VTNTLAYHVTELITAVNSFIIEAPGARIIKLFTVGINYVVQCASAFAIVSHFLLALTNTLAFYVTELITAVISFMIQAPGAFFLRLHLRSSPFVWAVAWKH